MLETLRQDLRYAARTLGKQPGFAAAVIVTIALGVGGTTAIFSVVNGVLLNPLPYPDSDALVRIVHSIGASISRTSTTRSTQPMRTTLRPLKT
jgi:hypothetical protein